MRRKWAAGFFLVALCTLAVWANVTESQASSETVLLKLCYENVDARPWRYRRGGGLDIQLLDRAAQKVGIRFLYESKPREDCLAGLRGNKMHGFIGRGQDLGSDYTAFRVPVNDEDSSYLLLSSELADRQPELANEIRRSIDDVRNSAAYLMLKRHAVTALGTS